MRKLTFALISTTFIAALGINALAVEQLPVNNQNTEIKSGKIDDDHSKQKVVSGKIDDDHSKQKVNSGKIDDDHSLINKDDAMQKTIEGKTEAINK